MYIHVATCTLILQLAWHDDKKALAPPYTTRALNFNVKPSFIFSLSRKYFMPPQN